MEPQTRTRPKLEPVRIEPLRHGSPGNTRHPPPRSPRRRPSIFKPPLRPHSLPSPLHPSTPGLDQGMRRHERAMLDSFDQRKPSQARKDSVQLLPSIPEQSPPLRDRPYHAYSPPPTLVAQTRSLLLYGAPGSQFSPVSTPAGTGRRQSLPTGLSSALPTSIPSAALPSPVGAVPQQTSIGRRKAKELYGINILSGCFVKAVNLQKFSESSASGDSSAPQESAMDKTGQRFKYSAKAWSPSTPQGRFIHKYLHPAELREMIPNDPSEPLEAPSHATDHTSPRRASLSNPKERRLDKEHRRLSAPILSVDPLCEMALPVRKCPYQVIYL